MITDIQAKKLVVISDLHLGNPFSKAKQKTVRFLHWAHKNDYDICINGDGFEIAQVSFTKLAKDIPEVLQALKAITKEGRNVYYVVGNHDIVFEHFLNDWGGFKVAPFLNVWSDQSRLRIEHGHLYDPFFVKQPQMYEFCTWFAGFFLGVAPKLYHLWIAFEKLRSKLWKKAVNGPVGIQGEHPDFLSAVRELSRRGFDHIVFGHTHHTGQVDLGNGQKYMNPGSWMLTSHYVEIKHGQMAMLEYKD